MRKKQKSVLEYVLLALVPCSKESFDLAYNPRKFFWQIEKMMDRDDSSSRNTISVAISRGKKKGYLKETENDNKEKTLQLTTKGRIKIYKFLDQDTKTWDGKWRILFFDIPEKEKIKRNFFRRKLKEMGFKRYQLSAWISPFDYADEIDVLIAELNIDHYVQYIIGESIKGKEMFEELFGLKNSK